ncbi:MAG: NAD(P)H-dependent oxidoreductase subunit E [Spirochaetes bacterium]|nr:NAD(P)H-dependent oxidoreductase subunit E [Spirochaetota bacterium]NLJ04085.1 NAD(P)H-dependent oxidoreductase subunit E [Exilispira sp.]MBP8990737.1 NAD(P)H-dependent oxidoreductase subunit E [Spirochaetota bacterium]HNV43262.1 NAD(P)H-dependent oxidoreductase subunit E [Exilispira sp.]HOV45701.1 NAD(P)H-dependent oxidoreductase subunit E [Exilispira sp.]
MIEADQGKLYDELKQYIDTVKSKPGILISVLHKAQGLFGYLPVEVQKFIAMQLNLPFSQVYGVVTFYNFFSMKPKGKHVINVCLGTACYVKGAEKVVTNFEDALHIKMGETTSDKMFTLSSARCFGACGLAPAVMVDDEVYGQVDKKKIGEIIKKYGG